MSASKILRERRKMAKEILEHMRRKSPYSAKSLCIVCGKQLNEACAYGPDYRFVKHIAKHSKSEMVTAIIREAMEQS